ncbi:type II secretion system F family protein [Serpentinicella alkaliphila]|nr:type II secretion system F family protein [Serpentinicella alkaliphila]
MNTRLERLKVYSSSKNSTYDEELQKSFADRIVKPVISWLANITQRVVPIRKKDILEKKLMLAGNPWDLTSSEFLTLYYGFTTILVICVFILAYLSKTDLINQVLSVLWGLVFSRVIFDLFIRIKIKNRQGDMSKELPDVLDLLTVSVESGLGFDAAIQKVVKKTKGPISYEFSKTLQEIKMGKTRRDALKDLGDRTGVEDLNTFIGAIIQADQLGVSIGNVLRIQSKQMRQIRKQRIEEKAMKAPIKMLLPMVFFIFPTLFLVLLGPAAIQLIESLG